MAVIHEFVQNAVAEAQLAEEQARLNAENQERAKLTENIARFRALLEQAGIDGPDLARPELDFEHDGVRYSLFLGVTGHLHITQICTVCNQNSARGAEPARDQLAIGRYIRDNRGVCPSCRRDAPAMEAQRSAAERLEAAIRDVAEEVVGELVFSEALR